MFWLEERVCEAIMRLLDEGDMISQPRTTPGRTWTLFPLSTPPQLSHSLGCFIL